MKDFGTIYDNMSTNYRTIENMMVAIYSQIQSDPSNSQLIDNLQELGTIAKGMLQTQIDFTETYCMDDIDLKNSLVGNLYSRYDELTNVLNETKGRAL